MDILPEHIDALPLEEKRTLLRQILQDKRNKADEFPLSWMQEQLWVLDQLEPGNVAYNIPLALHLRGPLDVPALQQSLNALVQRHESLRTTFALVNGQPVQRVLPSLHLQLALETLAPFNGSVCTDEQEGTALAFTLTGLTAFPASLRASFIQRTTTEAQIPFDLRQGPLIRACLLRLDTTKLPLEHILLLTLHHIIFDAWSLSVLFHDLGIFYQALVTTHTLPNLPTLPVQYGDFACWQREQLQGEHLATLLSYWQEQLADLPPVLKLPPDLPRPPVQTYRGALLAFRLPSPLGAEVHALCRQEGVTPFMVLLTSFQLLLTRYTGQSDIAVGVPIAGRTVADLEGLIGYFVNTLVLRTNFAGARSVREALQRVRETALGAYNHQDLPFVRLVQAIQRERDLSYSPLVQVLFLLQNTPPPTLDLCGAQWSPLDVESGTAKFDLTLECVEDEQGFSGHLEYNTDLFRPKTMQRLLGHWQTLLAALVTDPTQPLDQLSLLTTGERYELLMMSSTDSASSAVPKDDQRCLHELVAQQAQRTPDALAVIWGEQEMSYGELNRQVNRLAHYLRTLGVAPEVRVGICLERSAAMVVALLAVLKAGGAYVPLDPAYPSERLEYMLGDAQIAVLLTQEKLHERLFSASQKGGMQIVCLDTDAGRIMQESEGEVVSEGVAANLAYVLYTSGSTGVPKGVAITHRSAVVLMHWAHLTFSAQELGAVLAGTSICFDLSVFEIFAPLSWGGSVVVAENALQLPSLPAAARVSLLNTVPSVLTELLYMNGLPDGLQTVNLAGEPLRATLVERLFAQTAVRQVYNLYGPTEDTTYSTGTLLSAGAVEAPPIGWPLPHTQVYVLDRHLQPVPMGVVGELYIGGAGLARGYLHRPDLTAERFLPHPFSTQEGQRLYRTGDLVRLREDGALEYVGREDQQVKVRGFRIELGEIETVLGQHPAVREAVVLARSLAGEGSNPRLVAYVVSHQEVVPTVFELRAYLRERLPEYMVPAAVVLLSAWPLTPNGKVDRRRLPESEMRRSDLPDAYVAPRTPLEEQLVQIWSSVLRVDRIGIYDNFFDLGGDSILNIQIVARANQAGIPLTPRLIFKHQTIAEVISILEVSLSISAEQGVVVGTVPLTPIQLWFLKQNLLEPWHWNQEVILETCQSLDLALLEKTIQVLLAHHDALRLRFICKNGNWSQINEGLNALSVPTIRQVDLSGLSCEEQNHLIEVIATELHGSLNLTEGPLIRAAYFSMESDRPDRILIVIHHLVVDGVSWRILLEDMERVYQQLKREETVNLLAKTTAFQQWAYRLVRYAQSDSLRSEIDYWQTYSWLDIPQLPLDYPGEREDNIRASAKTIVVSISSEETRILFQSALKAYSAQINDLLLTALLQAFHTWTGERILFIDMEGHGREDIFSDVSLSRTIGWFTTIFPLLLTMECNNIHDTDGFCRQKQMIERVKGELQRIPQHGIGYGLLCYLNEDQGIAERFARVPQAEMVFNYLGQFDQSDSERKLFRLSYERSGQECSPRDKRPYLLEINSSVIDGQLMLEWTYSSKLHRAESIERFAKLYVEVLRDIIAIVQSHEMEDNISTDFPEAGLSQATLDDLLTELGKSLE